MSHFLTEEQSILQATARSFAQKDVEPLANRIDEEEATPPSIIAACADIGFFGLYIPEEYGGSGCDLTTTCIVLEEIAKASPALAGLLSVQIVLCPATVALLGTDDQKQRLLPPSASGKRLMAYSATEPAGAANIGFHQTRLTANGNHYLLNGAKLYCTQGEAKTYLVWARTSQDGQEGHGCAIVEQDAPGFSVAPYEHKLGWRGTNTGPISFDDIVVTPDNILGNLLTSNIDQRPVGHESFLAHSATALGCLEGLFDKTLAYVKERQLYGTQMYNLQPVKYWLADIYNRMEACRALLYTYTRMIDEGRRAGRPLGSIAKSYICDTTFECSSRLLQMWGGSGIMNSTGVNRYFRDARTKMIAEGPSEVHTSVVASLCLGLGAWA